MIAFLGQDMAADTVLVSSSPLRRSKQYPRYTHSHIANQDNPANNLAAEEVEIDI